MDEWQQLGQHGTGISKLRRCYKWFNLLFTDHSGTFLILVTPPIRSVRSDTPAPTRSVRSVRSRFTRTSRGRWRSLTGWTSVTRAKNILRFVTNFFPTFYPPFICPLWFYSAVINKCYFLDSQMFLGKTLRELLFWKFIYIPILYRSNYNCYSNKKFQVLSLLSRQRNFTGPSCFRSYVKSVAPWASTAAGSTSLDWTQALMKLLLRALPLHHQLLEVGNIKWSRPGLRSLTKSGPHLIKWHIITLYLIMSRGYPLDGV